MSIIPIVSARELLNILLKAGFKIVRQKGSHIWLKHPITKKVTTIPMHVGDLPRRLLMKILKQAGISIKEFLKLLGK